MENPAVTLLGVELILILIMAFFRKITGDSIWNKWMALVGALFIIIDLIAIPKLL